MSAARKNAAAEVGNRIDRAASAILAEPKISDISLMDPRFRWVLPELPERRRETDNLGRVVMRLRRAARRGHAESVRLLEEIRDHVVELRSETLEGELAGILAPLLRRQSEIWFGPMLARLGWAGRPPVTLEAAAGRIAVTRERIRQVQRDIETELARQPVWTPVLDRAVALLAESAPVPAAQVGSLLQRAGIVTDPAFSAESVVSAHQRLQDARCIDLVARRGASFVVPSGGRLDLSWLLPLRRFIQKELGRHSIVSVEAIVEGFGHPAVGDQEVGFAIQSSDSWQVLEQRWIVQEPMGPRNVLLRRIRKVLVVVPEVSVTLVHRQLMREGRPARRLNVDLEGLRVFARHHPDLTYRDGDLIASAIPLDPAEVLSEAERLMLETLGASPAGMSLSEAVAPLRRTGLSQQSAELWLRISPIVVRPRRDLYRLVACDAARHADIRPDLD